MLDKQTKTERKILKQQKELQKWRTEEKRPEYARYFAVMMLLMLLFEMFDRMATSVYGNLQETIVRDFAGLAFDADITVNGSGYQTYQDTLSTITLASLISYGFMGIIPFYKALADRKGRRVLYLLNAVFLGGAMFLGGITHNIFLFVCILTIIMFFTQHDMQILYVMENVKPEKRGFWQGVVNAVGQAAVLLVIVMRLMAGNGDGTYGQIPWRTIFIIIGIVGLGVFVIAFFLLRESKPFVKARIEYLEKTPEERKKLTHKGKSGNTGVIAGFKIVFKNKQLRWLAIVTLVVSAANNMLCSYGNSIMAQNGMDDMGITAALVIFNVVSIISALFMGSVSDKIGRRMTVAIFSFISALSFILFVFGASFVSAGLPTMIFAGITNGLAVSSYMNVLVLLGLMFSESGPTSLRGSIMGVRSFFQVTAVIAMAVSGALFRYFPTGPVCCMISVPCLIAAGILMLVKVQETRNWTMEEVEEQFR